MKKKKLIGKLSLNKSKISNLDGSKIMGGGYISEVVACGSNITCDIGCQHLGDTQGSACKCL
jgi:hypothetical protein